MAKIGKAIVAGWIALALGALAARGLVWLTARITGAEWVATFALFFDCGALALAGFVAGRLAQPRRMVAAALLAVPLCFFDFESTLTLNAPWLIRLALDSMHDSRFVDSLIASAETHAILFGCLFAAAALSGPADAPPRIVSS
jgi:hypothetical protein